MNKDVVNANNEQEYQRAQQKIISALDNNSISEDDRVYLLMMLANTYKRLSDYETVLKYLNEARNIAVKSDKNSNRLLAKVEAEISFAYFDIQHYAETKKIMDGLEKNDFKYLDDGTIAKIVMQQGYLHYMNKEYADAEKDYAHALSIMRSSDASNQPIVLVKQMQMYNKMGDTRRMMQSYKEAIRLADSCDVLKYKIYATSELLNIYKVKKDFNNTFIYQRQLDSMETIYKANEKLAQLHLDNQEWLEKKRTEENNQKWQAVIFFTALSALLTLALFYYFRKMRYHKKQKQNAQKELQMMREQLNEYIFPKEKILHPDYDHLTDRQKQLLSLIHEGMSNKEIADRLFISENTVKYHIKNLYGQLEVKNRKEIRKTSITV